MKRASIAALTALAGIFARPGAGAQEAGPARTDERARAHVPTRILLHGDAAVGQWIETTSRRGDAPATVSRLAIVERRDEGWLVEYRTDAPPVVVGNEVNAEGRTRRAWAWQEGYSVVERTDGIPRPSSDSPASIADETLAVAAGTFACRRTDLVHDHFSSSRWVAVGGDLDGAVIRSQASLMGAVSSEHELVERAAASEELRIGEITFVCVRLTYRCVPSDRMVRWHSREPVWFGQRTLREERTGYAFEVTGMGTDARPTTEWPR